MDTITTTGNVDISGSLKVETSLTTSQLIVDNKEYFDTIVIRWPTDVKGETINGSCDINLFEFQCWVNDTNILFNNSSDLVSYFALWADKDDIGQTTDRVASLLYDNNISETGLAHTPAGISEDVAVIIKNVPKTSIKQIQSLVVYNRTTTAVTTNRAIGLAIELNNIDTDPNLDNILSSTNVITTAEDVYRFDFPAIDTMEAVFLIRVVSPKLRVMSLLWKKSSASLWKVRTLQVVCVDTITTTGNVDVGGTLSVSGSLRTNTSVTCASGEILNSMKQL